jgi:hypothetical protein
MAPEGEPGQTKEGRSPADVSETASVRRAFHSVWMRGLRASAVRRYGVAIVAAVGASLIRILLNPFWGTSFLPYVFLFPATLFSALFGGLGPAALGIAICAVMAILWILPPIGSLFVASPLDLVGLAAFIVADGIIAWIGAYGQGHVSDGCGEDIGPTQVEYEATYEDGRAYGYIWPARDCGRLSEVEDVRGQRASDGAP